MARVRVSGDGAARRWTLHLPPAEARVVAGLPRQLEDLLAHPERNRRVVERLFPASYSDPAEQAEHRRLLGASLLEARRELLADVRKRLEGAPRGPHGLDLALDEAGLDRLLRFVNDVRLVLATDLGLDRNLSEVQVRAGDPDAPRWSLLVYLGALEHELVTAAIGDPGF